MRVVLFILILFVSACYTSPDLIDTKRTVTYQVNSSKNAYAIYYRDVDNIEHKLSNAPMPWSFTFNTTAGSYVSLLVVGTSGYTTTAKLIVDGKTINQMSSTNEGMLIYQSLP